MERRFAIHAAAQRQALIFAIVLAAGHAAATPVNKDARAHFDRAVTAYKRGDFVGASELFQKSYAIETDPDALFGWAQAERKSGHCEKAIALYQRLLSLDIPAENKEAVHEPLAECQQAITPKISSDQLDRMKIEAHNPMPTHTDPPAVEAPPPDLPRDRPWYRDPVGDTLVGLGVVGIGVGTVLLVSARSADASFQTATNYGDAQMFRDLAQRRGQQCVLAAGLGGALLVAGVIRYVTHASHDRTTVAGWLAPGGGGVALGGGF